MPLIDNNNGAGVVTASVIRRVDNTTTAKKRWGRQTAIQRMKCQTSELVDVFLQLPKKSGVQEASEIKGKDTLRHMTKPKGDATMNTDSTPHASASGAANQAGSFSFPPMKPALSFSRQVCLMRERGLVMKNDTDAATFLSETNYYRLRGYWLTFEQAGRFKNGTTLEDIREVTISMRNCAYGCGQQSNPWKSRHARLESNAVIRWDDS